MDRPTGRDQDSPLRLFTDSGEHRFHRKSIMLKMYDDSWPGWYFITLCAKNRECMFGEVHNDEARLNAYGAIVQEEWSKISTVHPGVQLDSHMVMPNHLHGIIIIGHQPSVGAIQGSPLREGNEIVRRRRMLLPKIISMFKMNSAKRINLLRHTPGVSVWQRNYYEHIIRNDADLRHIREHIQNNPLQWPLDEDNPAKVRSRDALTQSPSA